MKFNKPINIRIIFWEVLLLVSVIGVILMWCGTWIEPEQITRDPKWLEKLILPFYFTFISNIFAVVASLSRTFNLIKNKKYIRRLEIFMAVNLLLTLIVFWAVLFPAKHPHTPLKWAENMTVHLITPSLAIATFFVQNITKRNNQYFNPKTTAFWHLLFLLGWFIMALVMYFANGAIKAAAIYSFLRIKQNHWYMSMIYVIVLPIVYYIFTYYATKLTNDKFKSRKISK